MSGAVSLLTMPVENMPPVAIGKVFVSTVYYGASAEDVEDMEKRWTDGAISSRCASLRPVTDRMGVYFLSSGGLSLRSR